MWEIGLMCRMDEGGGVEFSAGEGDGDEKKDSWEREGVEVT